jgi:hypothetical protein
MHIWYDKYNWFGRHGGIGGRRPPLFDNFVKISVFLCFFDENFPCSPFSFFIFQKQFSKYNLENKNCKKEKENIIWKIKISKRRTWKNNCYNLHIKFFLENLQFEHGNFYRKNNIKNSHVLLYRTKIWKTI